ncbi:hypothetical protein SAMN04489712_112217 [Thermomonospora echinospora]|uniref:Uncharacterized protein n=1 Tax=Thermomonospora echinospora TaxID=1992 RepID=A0A1H6D2E2_9ACTN|nr:hypothetical protein [Thermomonospora echinospora]SEG79447.1 hypothetical protein SAMN04489712_112217 [Thermomonospora echinospora]
MVAVGYAAGTAGAALGLLRTSATMSQLINVGVAIAATAVANVPAMGDAAANWTAIAARMDGGVKGTESDIIRQVRQDWIADDGRAFIEVVNRFTAETEATRKFFDQVEKSLDDIGDAYRTYWYSILVMAGTALSVCLVAFAMLFTPLFPQGMAILQWMGALACKIIALLTTMLKGFLAIAATTLATGAKGMMQLFNIKPTGGAAIDFTQTRVDMNRFNDDFYQNPNRPNTAGGFHWVAPKRDEPEPIK